MKDIVNKVFNGKKLSARDIEKIVFSINNETSPKEQIAAILGAISARKNGIFDDEISNFAKSLRKFSTIPPIKNTGGFMDVCGTGGDCAGTFNISTAVSFIIASLGVKVIKHGARATSSKCGSADVIEEIGIKIDIEDDKLQHVLDSCNMVFLLAQKYNLSMGKIKKLRNSIGAPTIFNLLGPLINPIKLDYQVMGIYDKSKCETVIGALKKMGLKRAMVVHGGGLDELSVVSPNTIYYLNNKKISKIKLPALESLGLKHAKLSDIQGGERKENAKIILDILNGKKGAKTDIVLLNSAAALICAGIAKDFPSGVNTARKAIEDGLAIKTLERMKDVCR